MLKFKTERIVIPRAWRGMHSSYNKNSAAICSERVFREFHEMEFFFNILRREKKKKTELCVLMCYATDLPVKGASNHTLCTAVHVFVSNSDKQLLKHFGCDIRLHHYIVHTNDCDLF
jgi:hypothetical protein